MAEAELSILLSLQDNCSRQLNEFKNTVASTDRQVQSSTATLAQHNTAVRQLGMGLIYAGSTFLAMGIALEQSKNQLIHSAGQMLVFGGAMMSAIGSAIEFIAAIGRITKAIQSLAAAQFLLNMVMNPAFWAVAAVAVIGGAIAFEKLKSKVDDANTSAQGLDASTQKLNSTLNELRNTIDSLGSGIEGLNTAQQIAAKNIAWGWEQEGMPLDEINRRLKEMFGLTQSIETVTSKLSWSWLDFLFGGGGREAVTPVKGPGGIGAGVIFNNYQSGGIVPGPTGQPVPIIAHGGERYLGSGGGAQSITINLNVPGHMSDQELLRTVRDGFFNLQRYNRTLGFS